MWGVVRRYMKDSPAGEDVMVEAFYKVFSKLNTFKHNGSFEGWIRRIVVNECLMKLRKRKTLNLNIEVNNLQIAQDSPSAEDNLYESDILQLLSKLPDGYRTVFNLYVIEGFKHREIAEQLGISINTSKSQLILAKKKLKELVQSQYPNVG